MTSPRSLVVRPLEGPQEFERAFAIRRTVFVEEQRVPEPIERDEHDATAIHLIALDGDTVVGTGRLAVIHGVARIGRMAILPAFRGRGVGRQLLMALLDQAQAQGWSEVHLAAQLPVEKFYARLGFEPYGEIFEEAGILHRMMHRLIGI